MKTRALAFFHRHPFNAPPRLPSYMCQGDRRPNAIDEIRQICQVQSSLSGPSIVSQPSKHGVSRRPHPATHKTPVTLHRLISSDSGDCFSDGQRTDRQRVTSSPDVTLFNQFRYFTLWVHVNGFVAKRQSCLPTNPKDLGSVTFFFSDGL